MNSSFLRCLILLLLSVGVWGLTRYGQALPEPLAADAPPAKFSAARADAALSRILGPEKSRFIGTAENAQARTRILRELETLGVRSEVQQKFICNGSRQSRAIRCTTINNIIGHVVEGQGPALVLMAHYDSVGAGPGAGDDASGVVTILESVRALKADNSPTRHPLLILFTDGEEAGLLGARAFLQEPAWRTRVGAVINVEARGTKGQSLLFQTSPGDAALVSLYAENTSTYAMSSLFPLIYRILPNDTDLTPFLSAGIPGANFAFIEGAQRYHTALDRREFLDSVTLQQHGDNVLGIARGLMTADFATLSGGSDAIYLTILGRWLPRAPSPWALPLAVLAFAGIVTSLLLTSPRTWKWSSVSVAPLLIIGALLTGLVLHSIASLVSGNANPAYAYPTALRIALSFGLAACVLWIARLWNPATSPAALWFWPALFGVLTAAFLPGLSPYFIFPLLIAMPLLLIAAFLRSVPTREAFVGLAAMAPLLVWMGMAAQGEGVMGLMLHPLFTLPAIFAVMGFVPLMGLERWSRKIWLYGCCAVSLIAVVLAVFAGLLPAYSPEAPQRLNIACIEDHAAGKSYWSADALTPRLRQAGNFSTKPAATLPFNLLRGYVADGGKPRLNPPRITISSDRRTPSGRVVRLTLNGSGQTASLNLSIPLSARPQSATINGREVAAPSGDMLIGCLGTSCNGMEVSLTLGSASPFEIFFAEQRQGLPPEASDLIAARGNAAVPSQMGDVTVILAKARVP